jgi:hypothetical protein
MANAAHNRTRIASFGSLENQFGGWLQEALG